MADEPTPASEKPEGSASERPEAGQSADTLAPEVADAAGGEPDHKALYLGLKGTLEEKNKALEAAESRARELESRIGNQTQPPAGVPNANPQLQTLGVMSDAYQKAVARWEESGRTDPAAYAAAVALEAQARNMTENMKIRALMGVPDKHRAKVQEALETGQFNDPKAALKSVMDAEEAASAASTRAELAATRKRVEELERAESERRKGAPVSTGARGVPGNAVQPGGKWFPKTQRDLLEQYDKLEAAKQFKEQHELYRRSRAGEFSDIPET